MNSWRERERERGGTEKQEANHRELLPVTYFLGVSDGDRLDRHDSYDVVGDGSAGPICDKYT